MKFKRIISILSAAVMLFCSIGLGNTAEAANLTKEQQEQFEKAIANGGVWINFGDLEFSTPIQIPDVTAEEFIVPDTPSFSDVAASHWAYENIEEAKMRGWVEGTGNGSYSPEKPVTYAQWITMLFNVYFPEEVKVQPAGEYWYSPYYSLAMEKNVLVGTQFEGEPENGNKELSREEMAKIVYHFITDGLGRIYNKSFLREGVTGFSDVASGFVLHCANMGILSGTGNGKFSPKASMTRAQAAAVLCRIPAAAENDDFFLTEMESLRNNGNAAKNTLKNGKAITEENVLEVLNSLPEYFVIDNAGTWYQMNNGFNPSMPLTKRVAGCATIAYEVSDYIFGDLPFTGYTEDASKARAGDLVIFLNGKKTESKHFGIIIGNYGHDRTGRPLLDVLNGSGASWGAAGITEKYEMTNTIIYTRYPDIDSSFTPVN